MSRAIPDAPLRHGDAVEHLRLIAQRANASLPKNGTQAMSQPLTPMETVKANLPDASTWQYAIIVVTDDVGGPTLALSDGTNWLRVSDNAVVS